MIGKVVRDGRIKGVKYTSCHFIAYLLFVDDVLLFGKGTMEEWIVFHEIIWLFFAASGMKINMQKSSFLTKQVIDEVMEHVFPFHMDSTDTGFKYLGYFMNPNNYLKVDWM